MTAIKTSGLSKRYGDNVLVKANDLRRGVVNGDRGRSSRSTWTGGG